jgi:TniQ
VLNRRRLLGRVWPAYSKPQDDELLSSWLVRLSMAHGLKLHTFCSLAWPGRPIRNRDIDKSADEGLLAVLSEKTDTPLERVRGTTLSAYEGVLYEKHNPFGNTLWIMPVGVYLRVRMQYGLQLCPRCLAEDKEPYFRRRWRLAFVTVCGKHGVALNDRCPRCGEAVNFHRNELGLRNKYAATSMTLCHACRFDLRTVGESSERGSLKVEAAATEVEFQEGLLNAVRDEWIVVDGQEPVYSYFFFRVLRQLMQMVATRKRSAALRAAAIARWDVPAFTTSFSDNSRVLERLDIDARRRLLAIARYMLEDWPDRFVEYCEANRVWSLTLPQDLDDVPYWYWRVVTKHQYLYPYCPSNEEIDSAVAYLRARNRPLNKKSISELLGVTAVHRKRRGWKPESDDNSDAT